MVGSVNMFVVKRLPLRCYPLGSPSHLTDAKFGFFAVTGIRADSNDSLTNAQSRSSGIPRSGRLTTNGTWFVVKRLPLRCYPLGSPSHLTDAKFGFFAVIGIRVDSNGSLINAQEWADYRHDPNPGKKLLEIGGILEKPKLTLNLCRCKICI